MQGIYPILDFFKMCTNITIIIVKFLMNTLYYLFIQQNIDENFPLFKYGFENNERWNSLLSVTFLPSI